MQLDNRTLTPLYLHETELILNKLYIIGKLKVCPI